MKVLEDGRIVDSEISVTNHQSTLRNMPEERMSHTQDQYTWFTGKKVEGSGTELVPRETDGKEGKRTEHGRSLRRVSNSDVRDRKQVLEQCILYDLLILKSKVLSLRNVGITLPHHVPEETRAEEGPCSTQLVGQSRSLSCVVIKLKHGRQQAITTPII
jgi:hypothetical protein